MMKLWSYCRYATAVCHYTDSPSRHCHFIFHSDQQFRIPAEYTCLFRFNAATCFGPTLCFLDVLPAEASKPDLSYLSAMELLPEVGEEGRIPRPLT